MLKWSEEIQILAGDMFDLLLAQNVVIDSLKPQIKATCLDMIKIWSQKVLLAWVSVYMRLEPEEKEFLEITTQMSQRNQPESVRCACITLLSKQGEAGV